MFSVDDVLRTMRLVRFSVRGLKFGKNLVLGTASTMKPCLVIVGTGG